MGDANTAGDPTRAPDRFARWFASPASVLIILPTLVVAVGIVVLLLGRKATRDSADSMARRQLAAQAIQVKHDIDATLGQAEPVLAGLRLLGDSAIATPDAMQRLHDLVVGRHGIRNASVVFPIGVMWQSYKDDAPGPTNGQLMSQESRVTDKGTERTEYSFAGGMHAANTEHNQYDPRTRPHYIAAAKATSLDPIWMEPRVFSTSHKTGLTVTQPVRAADGSLAAVLTIDFEVEELSESIGTPPIEGARTVVFVAGGTIIAYPAVKIPAAAEKENRLLRYADFNDPALDAMFAQLPSLPIAEQQFMHLDTRDGPYLASLATVGGATAHLDLRLASLVPESQLFGATKRFGRDAILASGSALLIALGVALMFAWNLVRAKRAVVAARAEAKSAQERAKELGSYRLVSKLGAGGMGEVWRAEHQLLARQAAIKLVRTEVLSDPAHAKLVQERFRREAQTLASLRSRNTIELYDYGVTDDGSFFFVMELLEGVDLSQLVREHGPQPAARVISLIAQACQSLAEAHDAGLLHRDIKPANLFVCRFGDEVDIVKLLDFGIAHNAADPVPALPSTSMPALPAAAASTGERLTVEGVVIGTPGYIPPEQATGLRLDARGDLYALGCVAWWLLTGGEVYTGVPPDDLIRTHVFEPVPELRPKVRGWLPDDLERIVLRCLAKKPEQRPDDARALAAELAEIPIPEEHAWTKAKAMAWWKSLRVGATSTPDAPTAASGVAAVGSNKAPPDAVTPIMVVPQRQPPAAEAMTAVARPSSGRIGNA